MTASNDLVTRLRENAQDDLAAADCPHVCRTAADRIEALEEGAGEETCLASQAGRRVGKPEVASRAADGGRQ